VPVESADGVELLLEVGLERRITGSSEVEIGTGDGRWSRRQVLLLRHSPSPRELTRVLAAVHRHLDGVFFVVDRAGTALAGAASRDDRIAYAAVADGIVCFGGDLYRTDADRSTTSIHSGRPSWARLAMLRLLALSTVTPRSQSAIAQRIGVSHVAVGKQLPFLEGLVERTTAGWRCIDRAACWDRFMTDYPGPRGLATYWAATSDVAAQQTRVENALEAGAEPMVMSGDFAADYYAPWRRPSRIVAYVATQPPLQEHGFATVRATDATVELRIPRDVTIAPMARAWPDPTGRTQRRFADPLITAWDLRRTPGGDVETAVDDLRTRALREPLWA
jgi:hypothetical protein